jgi:hypothetical protein
MATKVVTRVEVRKDAPSELADYDEIGLVEVPELRAVGWKNGRRRKLGKEAADKVFKLVGVKQPKPTRKKETTVSSEKIAEASGHSSGDTLIENDFITENERLRAENKQLLADKESLLRENIELKKELGDLKKRVSLLEDALVRNGIVIEQPESSERVDVVRTDSDEEVERVVETDGGTIVETDRLEPRVRHEEVPYEEDKWWKRRTGWLRSTEKDVYHHPDDDMVIVEERERYDSSKIAAAVAIGISIVALAFSLESREDHDSGLRTAITNIDNNQHVIKNKLYGHISADNARDVANSDRDHSNKLRDDKQARAINGLNTRLKRAQDEIDSLKKQESREERVEKLRGVQGGLELNNTHVESLDHSGDTVWDHVENDLQSELREQPSVTLVHETTGKVLKLNGLRWSGGGYGVDAHRLPVGFKLKVPNDLG